MNWTNINNQLPPEKIVVMTKVEDHLGIRNEQELIRVKNLWWTKDMKIYVYYKPTHWKYKS